MLLRSSRIAERAGVNAARSFFEEQGVVFQEVEQGNDYGKDAYLDLVDRGTVTGLCAAVQIKAGASYRRAKDYFIPVGEHGGVWRSSTIPIMGVVFDPEDGLLRWCAISDFLWRNPTATRIPVNRENVLDATSLSGSFRAAVRRSSSALPRDAVARVITPSAQDAHVAIQDCFALARFHPGPLIALRYILRALQGNVLHHAIHVIAHATPHPDIFWHRENWLPETIQVTINQHLVWSPDEIVILLTEVPRPRWQRGDIGQSLDMLFAADKELQRKWPMVIAWAFASNRDEAAHMALLLAVARSSSQTTAFENLVAPHKDLWDESILAQIAYDLDEFGYLSLYS